jgi:predicted kinase
MLKLASMKEKNNSREKLPLNQAAQKLGNIFRKNSKIDWVEKMVTPYGILVRLSKPRAKKDLAPDYRHKKNTFAGKINGQEVVVFHCSGEIYGQDRTYFRRIYENMRDILSGQKTQFTERRIVPTLLGYDDETMTLIMEKMPRELGDYLSSNKEQEIRRVIRGTLDLFRHVWEKSKEKNDRLPRYVSAFLEPEYLFLKDKKPENYLKDSKVIQFYRQTQKEVKDFLKSLDYQRGFGFGDISPQNLVENGQGQILFIDVGKPGDYHWLTMLGQLYQSIIEKAPNFLFSRVLKEEARNVIKTSQAVRLFALGRINRLLMGCTLRNIVFESEIGHKSDENRIRGTLATIRHLTQIKSAEEIIKYNSDEFDSWWRERLKDYSQSPEYKSNFLLLKKEIDQILPSKKPEKKIVFVFMGRPGSGKSALAQIVNEFHPSVILRSDWIFFEKLKDQIEDDYYKAYFYQEALARHCLEEGYSVIMDDNNRTVKNRTEVYQWAREKGAEPILIVIEVDPKIATERVTLKGKEIKTKEEILTGLRTFASQMEAPNQTEKIKVIRVDGNLSLEKIKPRLIKELSQI